MEELEAAFSTLIAKELFYLIAPNFIGESSSRKVYSFVDSKYVIKFETEDRHFQNVNEWNVWEHVEQTEYARWFAPCKYISPCGKVLIQEFADPILHSSELPKAVPSFFTDLKVLNFGLIGKQLVCVDYGYTRLLEEGLTKKMRAVDWNLPERVGYV